MTKKHFEAAAAYVRRLHGATQRERLVIECAFVDVFREFNPRSDPHALPDVETFEVDARGYVDGEPFVLPHEPGDVAEGLAEPGWYYWFCFPGCLPDSEPMGPFETEDAALADAREGMDDDDDEGDA